MNKALLLVLGVVVVASLVVGGLLGAVVTGGGIGGGSTGTDTPVSSLPTITATPTDASTPSPTPTATPTATPSPTPIDASTPTATPSPTPTATPTVAPRETFDRAAIERLVREFVNDRREAAGLDPLGGERAGAGPQATQLNRMARDHSVAMADAGTVAHELNGQSSADRYRTYELYRDCQWPSADGARQVTADDAALEAVGRTTAGKPYQVDDGVRVNANETQVARAIVENWWLSDRYNERLSRPGATELGVGVEITRTGEVYVTATLCG